MQKIDPGFLYQLGAVMRPLQRINVDSDWWEAYSAITQARDSIPIVVDHSIYAASIKQARQRGNNLASLLSALAEKLSANADLNDEDIANLHSLFFHFESALLVELQNASIYHVQPKGGFDLECLIDAGEQLFPQSLALKVPEALPDVREGARSLAFQLWTGSGFHFHRANESVLRVYMDHEAPGKRTPKMTMGGMVHDMRKLKAGHPPILAALGNLIEFHRNPLAHPQHTIETQDEAISLYAAIRAAMGYMLDKLPDPPPPAVIRMPTTQTIVAPPPPSG